MEVAAAQSLYSPPKISIHLSKMTTPLNTAPHRHDNLGTFGFKRGRGVYIKHGHRFSLNFNEIAEFRPGSDQLSGQHLHSNIDLFQSSDWIILERF